MKELALNKMLKEMMEKHTPSEDKIHNFLCEQDDNYDYYDVIHQLIDDWYESEITK